MNKTEEFIRKATLKHGDTYDYSKVEYKKSHEKVIIICKTHGEFVQTADKHINQGQGCKGCKGKKCGKKLVSNTTKFIEKALIIHGDKYDYSKVEYICNKQKVIIICKIHGEFLQKPNSHLQTGGCKHCGVVVRKLKRSSNTKQFIESAVQVHGDKYDYSNVEYMNSNTLVKIICEEHGEFTQVAVVHLTGHGCYQCGITARSKKHTMSNNEFIVQSIQLHGDKYDYSNVVYVKSIEKVKIICKEHGDFLQSPMGHLQGQGCTVCGYLVNGLKQRSNTEEFIKKAIEIHGDTYDYRKVEYIKSKEKVIIICKIHGEFLQPPHDHLCSSSCPLCFNKTEGKLFEKMKHIYPSITTQFKQQWCKNVTYLPYDFCIPEHKIIIELDGPQHFHQISNWQSPEETFVNDKYKEQCANDNNYSVIRLLQEDVWLDKYDWCKELCDAIKEIKQGDDIANIYLCKNCEYADF